MNHDTVKIYVVDTREKIAGAQLSVYENPNHGFQEIVSDVQNTKQAQLFRYFRFRMNPVEGAPTTALAAAITAAANPIGTPTTIAPSPPVSVSEILPSKGSNRRNVMNNATTHNIASFMTHIGIGSQEEFNKLAKLLEQRARVEGGRRTRKRRKGV